MALLPRISVPPAQAATPQSRAVVNARVASTSTSTVGEPDFASATQLDTEPFGFFDHTPNPVNDDEQRQNHKRQHFGLLNAPSESFASILEAGAEDIELDDYGNPVSRVYSGTVSKAIETYELNSKVISGTNPVRGTEISLTL
jgi:hypothetical protein